jgi:hypothetical protein
LLGQAAGELEPGRAARDVVKQSRSDDRAEHLRDYISRQLGEREASPGPKAKGHRGIQVCARDVSDGERHGEHREAEGERDPDEADARMGKSRSQHGTAAAAQHQPESPDELRERPVD